MSWIRDIKEEIKHLDLSKRKLRNFGITVGVVFLLVALLLMFRSHSLILCYSLGVIGIILFIFGVLFPLILNKIYIIWMGLAFAIGWVVSRILLLILFFFIITPIGFFGRLFGKEFLKVKTENKKETYWARKNKTKKINYEKMY